MNPKTHIHLSNNKKINFCRNKLLFSEWNTNCIFLFDELILIQNENVDVAG